MQVPPIIEAKYSKYKKPFQNFHKKTHLNFSLTKYWKSLIARRTWEYLESKLRLLNTHLYTNTRVNDMTKAVSFMWAACLLVCRVVPFERLGSYQVAPLGITAPTGFLHSLTLQINSCLVLYSVRWA